MNAWLWSLIAAAGAAGWFTIALRRNRGLVPPPITDAEGKSLPSGDFRYSDGEKVGFVDAGAGVPVLFVPGADGIRETFRYQVPAVASERRAVCADLRATFGPGDTFDRMVDDVAELVETLGLAPVILVGQSLGGSIAMRFASRHPERVAGLVISNSLARVSYEHVGLNRTLLTPVAMATVRYLPTWMARGFAWLWSRLEVWVFDDSPGADRVIEYVLWTGPRTVPSSVSQGRVDRLKPLDLRPELAAIRAPTLVIKGPRDHYTPAAWSEEIADLIPDARYVTIPGTGHCSHISMPGSFNRELIDWLNGIVPSTGGTA